MTNNFGDKELSQLKRALSALQEARAKLQENEYSKREPIAIVGIGCRLPGSVNSAASFWRMLKNSTDTIKDIPIQRWDNADFFDPNPTAINKTSMFCGGFIDDVDKFDPYFFGISPREAAVMDPQQRILLEVCWEALADAGIVIESLARSQTGVFIGSVYTDYLQLQLNQPHLLDTYSLIDGINCIAANRLSYMLDLRGPSMAIDTACSSSLVAVHLACQSLRTRECNLALAGGIQLNLSPYVAIAHTKGLPLSSDGHCKTFDAEANGYVRGEGVALVALKRLSDAIADRDNIWAVIVGSAVNQDGKTQGLTAPNGLSQQIAIRQALDMAKIPPAKISYIEAHGTGTVLGDPIEVESLKEIYGQPRPSPCMLGSVKTNIGHLEAAAGVVGLIKVALSLKFKAIAPNLHFKNLNPHISFENSPFAVPTHLTDWNFVDERYAAMNSFGAGGTNAHAIFKEPPTTTEDSLQLPKYYQPSYFFTLSARNTNSLDLLAQSYIDFFSDTTTSDASVDTTTDPALDSFLYNSSYTTTTRRSHYEHRLAIVANNRKDLVTKLNSFLRKELDSSVFSGQYKNNEKKVVFVFPGQGSQYVGMAREVLHFPVFRQSLETSSPLIEKYANFSPLALIESDSDEFLSKVDQIQPMIFAIQVALTQLWISWGVKPSAVVGHSMGEVAAAYAAGALTLDEAAQVICFRSTLMKTTSGNGAMLLTSLSADALATLIEPYKNDVSIASINSPSSTILSGDPQILKDIAAHLVKNNIFSRPVQVDIASHSPQMSPLQSQLVKMLQGIKPQPTHTPIYSTVTTEVISGTDLNATYWGQNLRQPVLFSQAIENLLTESHNIFLELSPHPILTVALEQIFAVHQASAQALPALHRQNKSASFNSLASLYTQGYPLNLKNIFLWPAKVVSLPTYCWKREHFWFTNRAVENIAPKTSVQKSLPSSSQIHPLLNRHIFSAKDQIHIWELDLDTEYLSKLGFYTCAESLFISSALLTEFVLAAALASFASNFSNSFTFSNLYFHTHPTFSLEQNRSLQIAINSNDKSELSFQVFSLPNIDQALSLAQDLSSDNSETSPFLHFSGKLKPGPSSAGQSLLISDIKQRCSKNISQSNWENFLANLGISLPENSPILPSIWAREGEAIIELNFSTPLTTQLKNPYFHPTIWEACFSMLMATLPALDKLFLPVNISALNIYQSPSDDSPLWLYARGRLESNGEILSGEVLLCDQLGQVLVEISFLSLQSAPPLTSLLSPDNPKDWLYQIQWLAKDLSMSGSSLKSPILIFSDDSALARSLSARLTSSGLKPISVSISEDFEQHSENTFSINPTSIANFSSLFETLSNFPSISTIIYLWPLACSELEPSLTNFEKANSLGSLSLLFLIQSLLAKKWSALPKLAVITRSAQPVLPDDSPSLALSPLAGLLKVINLEHADLHPINIDLAATKANAAIETDFIYNELSSNVHENFVAHRLNRRYVARLSKSYPSSLDKLLSSTTLSSTFSFSPNHTYFISGGLGAIGLALAQWMSKYNAKNLVLVSRSTPSATATTIIESLRQNGMKILVAHADLSDSKQTAQLFIDIDKSMPPLRGVFHLAGFLDDSLFTNLDKTKLFSVFKPKAQASWNLHTFTSSRFLDFFVLFSSSASAIGSAGQANYAAANAFLDSLAFYRRNLGLPAIALNWGPWADIGLAAQNNLAHRLSLLGFDPMKPQAALDLLLGFISDTTLPQCIVTKVDWNVLKPIYEAKFPWPFLSLLKTTQSDKPQVVKESSFETISNAPLHQQLKMIEALVCSTTAKILGFDPSNLDTKAGFFQLGMDSLMALQLKTTLETTLSHNLAATLVFDCPTIESLTLFLAKSIFNLDPSAKNFSNSSALLPVASSLASSTAAHTRVSTTLSMPALKVPSPTSSSLNNHNSTDNSLSNGTSSANTDSNTSKNISIKESSSPSSNNALTNIAQISSNSNISSSNLSSSSDNSSSNPQLPVSVDSLLEDDLASLLAAELQVIEKKRTTGSLPALPSLSSSDSG